MAVCWAINTAKNIAARVVDFDISFTPSERYASMSPTVHSITSSARSKIDFGTQFPSRSRSAVQAISNLTGSRTGNSAGFAPRKMRSA